MLARQASQLGLCRRALTSLTPLLLRGRATSTRGVGVFASTAPLRRVCAAPASRLGALHSALNAAPPVGAPSLRGLLLSARSSSNLAGIEGAGLPRLEVDSRGKQVGLKKGGKGRKNLGGVIAIKHTWNNTLISISDSNYKQLGFVSGGSAGFKKSKRSSQFATEKAIALAFKKARSVGIRRVMISMRGPAIMLRKPLFRQLRDEVGLRIMKLRMTDNVPHGGCRPRKSRRRKFRTRARKQRR